MRTFLLGILAVGIAFGQGLLPSPIAAGSGSGGFVYTGVLAGIPATCSVGQLAFITNATAGQNVFECTSTNVWTQQTGGGGGGVGTPAYTTTTITASPMTILAATHGQGSVPVPVCWNTATPREQLACGDTRNSSGDLVFTYTTTIGQIDIYGATGGFTNPMTTSGDTIYGGASGVATRLAKGTDGQVYTLASGIPSWAAAGGGSDPLDMATFTYIGFSNLLASFYPAGWSAIKQDGASNCTGGSVLGAATAGEALTVSYASDASSGNYCTLFMSAQDGGTTSQFTDLVSGGNYVSFKIKARVMLSSIVNIRAFVGVFSAKTGTDPTDGIYLEFDPAVSANWQCTVRSGGSSTRTTVGVAPSAGVFQTVYVHSSAAGTLLCAVGSTEVSRATAFPASTFWGFRSSTTTAAGKEIVVSNPRVQISFATH